MSIICTNCCDELEKMYMRNISLMETKNKQILELTKKNEELEGNVERLKCCGNCNINEHRCRILFANDDVCNNWKMK